MKKNVLQKRALSWLLILSMCIGLFPASAWANSESPKLLNGKEATTAMEVLYEENFDSYENATLQEGENDTYRLFVPEGSTAKIENGKLSYTASEEKPLYILGGEMWGYYTVEAEITTKTALAGMNLGFYVKDTDNWSKATKTEVDANTVYRMKVVANGTSIETYYAIGSGAWTAQGEAFQVVKGAQSGSVGFAMTPEAESASVTIDNIKVTRNMDAEDAKHTLFGVDFGKYTTATKMAVSNNHKNYYINTSGEEISVTGQNGQLHVQGSGVMYFDLPDAAHWKNYVVEADLQYAEGNTGWGGILYRVQNLNSYQMGYINETAGKAGLCGYWNGWANDGTDNNIYHETDFTATAGEARRVKLVVQDQMADLYVATYTEGTLGEWQYLMSINDVADHHPDGSVGFFASAGAEYWVDNLEVYEYTMTYSEDFEDYTEALTLTEGGNATVGIQTEWADTTAADTTMKVEAGQLAVSRTSGDSTKIDLAWFSAGHNWTNYVYEADITPKVAVTGSSWEGLSYRVDSSTLWQRAGLTYGATTIWNMAGAYVSGSFTPKERTVDLVNTTNQQGWGSSGYIFNNNQKMRMKIVADNNCTWIYYASYDANGNMGPYSLHVVLPICSSFTGSVGIAAVGQYGFSYDNVVVSAIEGEVKKENLADIFVPETGIVNPGTVVTKVNKSNIDNLTKTSVAIMHVNANLDIVDEDGAVIGSVAQFMKKYGDTIIPAFYLDEDADAVAVCSYLEKRGITDALYVTEGSAEGLALMKKARSEETNGNADFSAIGWRFARGIVDYKIMPEDRAQSRRDILNASASIAIFPMESLTADIVAEYNVRTISVWSYVEDAADVYEGVANGCNGMVATDASVINNVYESIKTTTVSGKPAVIGHGGKQGTNKAGETLEENTIKAFEAAVKEDNVMGIEVDSKKTKDGTVILYHDEKINGTAITSMTDDAVKTALEANGGAFTTLDDAFAFLAENPGIVMYFNTAFDTLYCDKMAELFIQYPATADQVVIFCRMPARTSDPLSVSSRKYGWLNEYWGDGIPVVGTTIGTTKSRFENITDLKDGVPKEQIINSMINWLAPYNHQQLPYDYDMLGTTGKRDSISYAMAARGYLLLQSAVYDLANEQAELDRFYISEMGTIALLADHTELTADYHYQIEAKDEIVKIGETFALEQTVKKLNGTETVTCGVLPINQGNAVKSGDSYTMNQEGSATFVYYADITQERGYGNLEYRIYSEPVTITWNEEGKPHEHSYSYKADAYYHWEVCSCGDSKDKAVHTPELVGQKDATETVAGYTGDKVCSVCKHVMEKGDTVAYDRFAGFTYVTAEDYGFVYGETGTGSKSATKYPSASLNKMVFVTRFDKCNSNLSYLRTAGGDYAAIQMYAREYSETTIAGYLYLANWTGDSKVYNLNEETQQLVQASDVYIRIYNYEGTLATGFELAITTEYCDADNDNNGVDDDIKVGIYVNGHLANNIYYYFKDYVGCQPGFKITSYDKAPLTEPTHIIPPHTHTYGAWKHDKEGHWHICTSCGKVADQTLHTEALVGKKEATATENGYTGDKVCSTCNYVIEKGEVTYYHEFEGYTVVTPADYGFTYDQTLTGSQSATKYPTASLNKMVFVARFDKCNSNLSYLRNASGDYSAIQMYAREYSETSIAGYLYLANWSGDSIVYTLNEQKQLVKAPDVYIRIYNYEGTLATGFELAITTEYCDADNDNNGVDDDIKVGIYVNGQLANNTYYYYKDYVGFQPGFKIANYDKAPLIDPIAKDKTIQPTITDSIALNYTATVSSMMAKTVTPTMTFERNGEVYGPVTGHLVSAGSNVYSFTYPDIMAQDMNQTIKATLTVGSQTTTYKYSVLEYCEDILEATSLEGYTEAQLKAAKDLVVDLVQYGAALQTYRGVAAGNLHTAKIANWSDYVAEYDKEDTELDSLAGSEGVITNKLVQEEGVEESTDYQWKSVTLVLGNKVKVRYKFTATNVYNLTVKVQVGMNEEVEVEYEKSGNANEYVFDFDNIYAYEYGTPITVRFYEGDTQVGGTVNYSVNTYLYSMKNYSGSKAEELKALLLAIHNYGEAAKNYQAVK